jgi:hypothetical protein
MTDDKKPLLLTRVFRQAEWWANLDFCASIQIYCLFGSDELCNPPERNV